MVSRLHHGRCAPPGLAFTKQRIVSIAPGLTPEDETLVMSKEDIDRMVHNFVDAGLRAKKAGIDLVEISACHGYLLAQFLSPLTNKREDEYGGSLENRLRFPLQIISGLRAALGKDFPISIRISVDEMYPGGLTLEESKKICAAFVDASIDMISVSASIRESYEYCMPPACVPVGWLADQSGAIRDYIQAKVPVMVSGRITTCAFAEIILEQHKADLVGMGRALIAAPDRVNAYAAGNEADCLPCLGCNVGCVDALNRHQVVSCAVNPLVGHESEYPDQKAAKKLRRACSGYKREKECQQL